MEDCMPQEDMDTIEKFSEKMNDLIMSGFTALSVAVGSKIGLFELMAQMDEPKTSQQIADAGDFKERYASQFTLHSFLYILSNNANII